MRGSVRRRGKTWYYVVDIGRDELGRRRQRFRGGYRTQSDAHKGLRDFLGYLDKGGNPLPVDMTFRSFAEIWMKHHEAQVQPRTHQRYAQLLDIHLLPSLGEMRLDRVRAAHLQGALDSINRSARTVQQARAVLSRCFGQAVAWGLIEASPVAATRAPKPGSPDLKVPKSSEIRSLLQAASGSKWEMPIMIAVYTGARRGEVLALRWADIDLDGNRASILRSLESQGREFRFKEPKTKRSRRQVAIPEQLGEGLRRHRALQGARRLGLGVDWSDLDLVCDRGDGRPVQPDAFSKAFKRFARAIGIPGTRLHDLRHAAATTMMEQGVHPMVVSRSLGHSSEAFTMAVYGHLRNEMLDEVALALADAYAMV